MDPDHDWFNSNGFLPSMNQGINCTNCSHRVLYECVAVHKIITVTLWWAWLRLKSPASRLFTQPLIQAQIKENIKAPRHWPLYGEFTGTGEFPTQRASNAENVSIWWRHHVVSNGQIVNTSTQHVIHNWTHLNIPELLEMCSTSLRKFCGKSTQDFFV